MAASATFALKAGVWFRRGRLVMVSPDSPGTACPLSGRNSTYRPVQISETGSEYACMPAHAFTKAPAGYTHVEAATLPCAGVTAWRGLVVCGQVKPGDSVLILGTGGVSLFALQLAKAAGARVIATSSSEEKLERLKRLGADTVINYKAVPDWGQKAKDLTDGRGVA